MRAATKVEFGVRMALLGLFLALLIGLAWQPAQAQSGEATYKTVLYFFWGEGCPHCALAKPWLDTLEEKYPELEVRRYEIYNDDMNRGLFLEMLTTKSVPEPHGVPTFFMDDEFWVGFNDSLGTQIEAAVQTCLASGCADAGSGIMPGASDEQPEVVSPAGQEQIEATDRVIDVPLFGTVNLGQQSLLASTLLIAFVDGFNPCSLWVLSMLLALTLHTGDRKKVAIIGLIFLTVTAMIYALFIAGLFTALSIVSYVGWIQVVVALIALFFGLVNIKDYFWYKEGVSFTIADSQKTGIFQRIRRVMDASESFWGMAGATIVLAAGVSLVEFSCTAGFPVLWTNLLSSQQVAAGTFVFLLIVYMLIYQLDELAIFGTAVLTLKSSRLEEKHGRILKLIGGTLMVVLAVVMIVDPYVMNNLGTSLLIFLAAFILALLILLVHRTILPSFGIWIGSEAQGRKKSKKRPVHKASRH